MPSAGALIPPLITPLRQAIPGKPSTHIDTATYVDLTSDSPFCKVYFTTDGTKPNPFQLKVSGKEITFKYKGPFTLKAGKRTLKAIAVSRDGLQESNVVTKTFNVDDVGPPDENASLDLESLNGDDNWNSGLQSRSLQTRRISPTKKKKTLRNSSTWNRTEPKEAWATSTDNYNATNGLMNSYGDATNRSAVQIPDGPFNPTNYSGTQVNLWGVSPPGGIPTNGYTLPYGTAPAHLGYMTNQLLSSMDKPKMTYADLRKMISEETMKMRPQQAAITYPPEPKPCSPGRDFEEDPPIRHDPVMKSESPGDGNWKGQLEHIHAHLIDRCKSEIPFRTAIAEPKLGKILHADFDEEDGAFLLTVSIAKAGHPQKPKEKKTSKPVRSSTQGRKTKPETPKAKPAPKAKPKKEPKREAYLETEEYEKENSSESEPEPPPPKQTPRPKRDTRTRPQTQTPRSSKSTPRSAKSTPTQPPKTTPSASKNKVRKNEMEKVLKEKETPVDIREEEEEDISDESSEEEVPDKDTWAIDPYYLTEDYEQEGVLKPWPAFNAENDCEKLRAAMKGLGTDEKAIIDILAYRCSTQRQEIVSMFKTMFGKDLKKELASETSRDFKEILLALCHPPAEYDASEVRRAIKGLGTDEDALIEILCTRTNAQIRAMKEAYKQLHNREMEKDVKGDTSGNFKKVLVSQIQANRDENPTFDRTAAKQDAQDLYNAGEAKWGTDESIFNMILCQRSFPHLRAVFEEYDQLSKKNIEDAIKSEFSGDIKQAYLAIVRCIRDKPLYFATKMQKAMKGLGTDDKALIRVVVSRVESDMVQIMESFQTAFQGSLAEWIKDDTSGDYRQTLLALVGEREIAEPTEEEIAEAEAEPELEELEEEDIEEDGTVVPADPFDAKKDCEVLKKAMKGLGTDEDAIIEVMGKRSNEQRLELVKMFKTMYGKDLIKELKSELSRNFKDLVVGLCYSPSDYDANELRKAMKGFGTDEDCLIEVLCTRDNQAIEAVKNSYTTLHGRNLEDDIAKDTSGHLKRLLVSLCQANRPDTGNTIDRSKARKDAKDLFDAGENKWGTDESRFNVILCSRSYPQLRATFEEYEKLANKDFEAVIKSETSGDLCKGYLTIVRCVKNQAAQFAKRLYDSMQGLGTDDDSLIRTVISRCEVDMVQIKEIFHQNYKQTLAEYIIDDTSGDYKKLLLVLIGEEGAGKKKKR